MLGEDVGGGVAGKGSGVGGVLGKGSDGCARTSHGGWLIWTVKKGKRIKVVMEEKLGGVNVQDGKALSRTIECYDVQG